MHVQSHSSAVTGVLITMRNTLSLPDAANLRPMGVNAGAGDLASIGSFPEATDATSTRPAAAVDSTELLRGQKTVVIHHNGAAYRLQATKLGKLILTK